jgi:hypothetical protein
MPFEAVLVAGKLDLAVRCCDATACCLFIVLQAFSLSSGAMFKDVRNVATGLSTFA